MRRALELALLSSLLAAAPPAFAEEPAPMRRSENPLTQRAADQAAAAPGQLTKAPELLEFVEATYPKEAEEAKLTGTVGLLVDIDATGAVTDVVVAEPAGHGFDEAAVEALRKFRFSPAEIDGVPAPVRIAYRYSFVLKPEEPKREERLGVVNLRGRVLQRGNREPVAGAAIALDDGALGATSDETGWFEIADVPLGKHTLVVNASGFERYETEEEIVEGKVTEVTLYVRKLIFGSYETVVRARRERKEVARVELEQEEIRLVPGTQGDAFKVIQNLPGVNRTPYGFGMLIVRGGRPNDTRVYLDGVHIPLLFHFGGLTSVINADLLADISFQPGNFDARFGRAIAGAVEGSTRTPSQDGYHGYLNASLIDTSALLEGPIAGDWSFAAAGRVSYVDLVLAEVIPSTVKLVSAPRYWDYQAKAEYAPKQGRDRGYVMALGARDSMSARLENPGLVDPEGRSEAGGSVAFHRLIGAWSHTISPAARNRLVAALGYDSVDAAIGADIGGHVITWSAQLRDTFTLELDPKLSLDFGLDLSVGRFYSDVTVPQVPLPGELPDPMMSRQLHHARLEGSFFEPAVYVEAVYKPFPSTKLVPGLRLDYEYGLRYFALDPRVALLQGLGEKTTLKAAVGLYQQPPDFRAGQWTEEFGNPDLGPERSLQTSLGVERKLTDALSVDVQVYYKRLLDLSYQSTRTIERDGQPVLERWANVGDGHTYGAEILVRHELTKNFFGWIAYSYSRSVRRSSLWTTDEYSTSAFDQPHHLVAVASYKWPYDWVTGVRFQFSSGNNLTPIQERVYDADADLYLPIPGAWNSERGPYFLSLDLRVDKRFVFEQWTASVYLDVQNVTNNENAESVIYNFDFTKRKNLRGLPIFPSLGVKAEF